MKIAFDDLALASSDVAEHNALRRKRLMTLTDLLLHEARVTYEITEKLFHRVDDEDLSWKPGTGRNWMTVGQLLMHCANYGCGKAVQGFVRGDWGLPEGRHLENQGTEQHTPPATALPAVKSVEQALSLLADDRQLALACIKEANEAELLRKTVAAPWGGPRATLFEHLLHMIAHLGQHKGQLFYYLKLMGKEVNTTDLWGD